MNRPDWEEPANTFFWQSTVSSSELNKLVCLLNIKKNTQKHHKTDFKNEINR